MSVQCSASILRRKVLRAFHPDKVGPGKTFTFAELYAEMEKYTQDSAHVSGERPVHDEAVKVIETLLDCQEFNRFMLRDLLAKTVVFKTLARRKCGVGNEKNIYIFTPGGYRLLSADCDARMVFMHSVYDEARIMLLNALDSIETETDKLISDAEGGEGNTNECGEPLERNTNECGELLERKKQIAISRRKVKKWGHNEVLNGEMEHIIFEAAMRHVEAWDDFDEDGHLLGGNDGLIDTSSGRVVVRDYEMGKDRVSASVGYDIKGVPENMHSHDYATFKHKLLRILKDEIQRDYVLFLISMVVLDGGISWAIKLACVVCAPKDCAKTCLFQFVFEALGPEYAAMLDFIYLTMANSSNSTNEAAIRRLLNKKRFVFVDEGADMDEGGSTARLSQRLSHARLKSYMSTARKMSRTIKSHDFEECNSIPMIFIAVNESNMFARPTNDDDLKRWVVLNKDSMASFQSGVDDDPANHVYAKDTEFLLKGSLRSNRLNMLTLLCEYYDKCPYKTAAELETNMPPCLIANRDNWDVGYAATRQDPLLLDFMPPAEDDTLTIESALKSCVFKTCSFLTEAPGKLVTLKVCQAVHCYMSHVTCSAPTPLTHPPPMPQQEFLQVMHATTSDLFWKGMSGNLEERSAFASEVVNLVNASSSSPHFERLRGRTSKKRGPGASGWHIYNYTFPSTPTERNPAVVACDPQSSKGPSPTHVTSAVTQFGSAPVEAPVAASNGGATAPTPSDSACESFDAEPLPIVVEPPKRTSESASESPPPVKRARVDESDDSDASGGEEDPASIAHSVAAIHRRGIEAARRRASGAGASTAAAEGDSDEDF
ncbi:MAG: hypothetical protein VW008_00010 [Aquiluna sp.]